MAGLDIPTSGLILTAKTHRAFYAACRFSKVTSAIDARMHSSQILSDSKDLRLQLSLGQMMREYCPLAGKSEHLEFLLGRTSPVARCSEPWLRAVCAKHHSLPRVFAWKKAWSRGWDAKEREMYPSIQLLDTSSALPIKANMPSIIQYGAVK